MIPGPQNLKKLIQERLGSVSHKLPELLDRAIPESCTSRLQADDVQVMRYMMVQQAVANNSLVGQIEQARRCIESGHSGVEFNRLGGCDMYVTFSNSCGNVLQLLKGSWCWWS